MQAIAGRITRTLLDDGSETVPFTIGQFEESFSISHVIIVVELGVDVDAPQNWSDNDNCTEYRQPCLKRRMERIQRNLGSFRRSLQKCKYDNEWLVKLRLQLQLAAHWRANDSLPDN